VALPPDVCGELALPDGAPGWRAERLTTDADSRPLVWDEAYFPGERVALRVHRRAAQTALEYEWILPVERAAGSGNEE
jgi:hypothetical protein